MNKQKGFTLIELMVVIAIIGILAAIVYPSYQDSVQKSRRADAKGALGSFATAMERHFSETGKYTGVGEDTGVPTIFSTKSPVDGTETYYNLTVQATDNSFTLTATPTGAQANDKCGTLTLTNTGVRGDGISTPSQAASGCW
jgi:type IV pilus assembly protein PilE